MSYLGYPRLHFAGRIHTDVATVNNVDAYYENKIFEPRFRRVAKLPDHYNGLWNPRGSGTFRLRGCKVTAVRRPDGTLCTTAAQDPLVGGEVGADNLRVSAKMVDLDPHLQTASQIWGLRVRLTDASGAELVRGDFAPAALDDLWMRFRVPGTRPDPSAIYQSVLTGLVWADNLASPTLRALRDRTRDNQLSIKFTADGVQIDPEDPDNVTWGRIVGSIGAFHSGEPRHFVAGRRLRKPDGGNLNDAPCQIDEGAGIAFVDLGNSFPTTGRGGALVPIGPLRLAKLDGTGAPTALAPLVVGTYEQEGAIATARLTPEQVAAAGASRLAVIDAAEPPSVLLAENADATMLKADGVVFRLYPERPHDTAKTTVFATRFGKPVAGIRGVAGDAESPPWLTFPKEFTTGPDGRAEVVLTGRDPGNPRGPIDGGIALVPYGLALDRPEGKLNVRVYDPCPMPKRPTWNAHVQPIFQQYANLYPVMHDVFDMANYHHVVKYGRQIATAMQDPLESPNHMPVTRDLSPGKRALIVNWLSTKPAPTVMEINTVEDLRHVLQQALLLELAVIPPYLSAQYSIKPDRNTEVSEIINGVVREEMLHVALVGNILNAVGGTPQIGRPGLVPTYPGKLPAPVLPDLTVRLRRCTIEQVRDVFMAIERPEYPTVDGRLFTGAVVDKKAVSLDRAGTMIAADDNAMGALEAWYGKAEYTPMTIGWFYNQIARAIIRLDRSMAKQGKKLFSGDPARQVSWPEAPGNLYRVTDRRAALLAIYEIIEQGEGSPLDLDGDGIADPEEFGHYYRFQEIVEGRRLIKNSQGRWVFEGPPVRLDPDGVYPMADDPDSSKLPSGSAVLTQTVLSNKIFTDLLASLNRVFNGSPNDLRAAVGLMYSLQVESRKLFELPVAPGAAAVAGPAFQSSGVPW